MGLCKCRTVTTLFCFKCKVNVCETCLISGGHTTVSTRAHGQGTARQRQIPTAP